MKVFVGGKVFDSRRDVIGVVLTDSDKVNIANMDPACCIYAESVTAGTEQEGERGFTVDCVQRLLDRIHRDHAPQRPPICTAEHSPIDEAGLR